MIAGERDVPVAPQLAGGWSVQRSGASRASTVHTQADAAVVRRRLARQDGVDFNLHGRNGRVREKDPS